MCIGLEKLPEESCDAVTKESIESIRSCFINNPSNVAWFNEQVKKIFQGEYEMPEIQNFKNPQETATDSFGVYYSLSCPAKINDDIHTAQSSEHGNNDSQEQNASSLGQLENTLKNQDFEDGSLLKEELRKAQREVFTLEGTNLTLRAQLAGKEKELTNSKEYALELEQEIGNLNHQIEEEMGLVAAQKLAQEESFEQAQQNLNDKLEREQKLYRDTAHKALDQEKKYKAQLTEREEELSGLRKSAQQMRQVIENLEKELNQAEQKNLSQQRAISDQSTKHSNYASAAFIICTRHNLI